MTNQVDTTNSASRDALFTAMANHRRRYAIYACKQANGELSLSDVAEQVAAWEYDKTIPEVTSDERKRIYTSLQQHHLSKLEDAGLIEFDGDTISLTAKAEQVDMYMEIVTEDTIPWSMYYLSYSIIAIVALGLTYFEVLPSVVTTAHVGFVALLFLLVSAGAHYLDTRQRHLDASEVPEVTEA